MGSSSRPPDEQDEWQSGCAEDEEVVEDYDGDDEQGEFEYDEDNYDPEEEAESEPLARCDEWESAALDVHDEHIGTPTYRDIMCCSNAPVAKALDACGWRGKQYDILI